MSLDLAESQGTESISVRDTEPGTYTLVEFGDAKGTDGEAKWPASASDPRLRVA